MNHEKGGILWIAISVFIALTLIFVLCLTKAAKRGDEYQAECLVDYFKNESNTKGGDNGQNEKVV